LTYKPIKVLKLYLL